MILIDHMKIVKIKTDMQMQCPWYSEKVIKMVILKGRISPTILSLAGFPYINNFINGLNTGGTSSRLACYCSWGDAAVLTEASHTYRKQFG